MRVNRQASPVCWTPEREADFIRMWNDESNALERLMVRFGWSKTSSVSTHATKWRRAGKPLIKRATHAWR